MQKVIIHSTTRYLMLKPNFLKSTMRNLKVKRVNKIDFGFKIVFINNTLECINNNRYQSFLPKVYRKLKLKLNLLLLGLR